MPAALNHYHVLGTSSSASFRELKKQYFQRAKECHPDLHDGSAAKEEQFKLLALAFEVLSDPHKRQQYDATLQASRGAPVDLEQHWQPSGHNSIMDTHADDILEELIVGNDVPLFATFQTLMRDLESTEKFVIFREAKTAFHENHISHAYRLLIRLVRVSSSNILYHYYLARCAERKKMPVRAARHYRQCLRIGSRRSPPQQLAHVHQRLHRLRQRSGLVGRIAAWLQPPDDHVIIDSERQMIDEVSRSMARLLNNRPARDRNKSTAGDRINSRRLLGSKRKHK
ncbi:MAG: DnaJ domain-containing protein [Lentisphaeria bacterium]|nr:DnaJ domain-containing protein [Lentisphaeria bacterium]MDP7739863.1 DnaJ domain-containing protein [Lentisphaeria bacterium]